jgi:CRP-like cAMP-binding protein
VVLTQSFNTFSNQKKTDIALGALVSKQLLVLTQRLIRQLELQGSTIETQLIDQIIDLSSRFGNEATLNGNTVNTIRGFTGEHLYEMIGCSDTMLSRSLSILDQAGLIKKQASKRIYIPSIEALQKKIILSGNLTP